MKCEGCGALLVRKQKRFCSFPCWMIFFRTQAKSAGKAAHAPQPRPCARCGTVVESRASAIVLCDACRYPPKSCVRCGTVFASKHPKRDKYCSITCASKTLIETRGNPHGPDHWNWKDAQGEAYRGRNWKTNPNRLAALERDKYICRECGTSHPHMHVHHIVPFDQFTDWREAHQLDNLLTLCRSCHMKKRWQLVKAATLLTVN